MTNKEITQIPKSDLKKFSVLCTFKLPISPQILEKFETVLLGYSSPAGKLIHGKNLKLKIS